MQGIEWMAGDRFTPEVHLKQPAFTHKPCVSFTKNKERNIKGVQDVLPKWTRQSLFFNTIWLMETFYEELHDKAFNVVGNSK